MTSKRVVGLLAMVLMSAQAFAMRVGDLQTQSRLNEPLRATLVLGDLTPQEALNLDVRVADAQTYERLGLERGASVEGLSFVLGDQSGSEWPLDIVGNRAIREPYLVLLLDIRSSSGRALREFTILLDPGPVAAQTPAVAEPEPASEPAAEIPAPQSYGIPETDVALAPPPPQMAQGQADAVAGNQPMVSSKDYQYARQQAAYSGEYGPVRAGESLSIIATQLAASVGAKPSQIAWGLYVANPQAFEGSINSLKRGAMLTVPSASELTTISVARARLNIRDAAAVGDVAGPGAATRPAPGRSAPAPDRDRLSAEVPDQGAAVAAEFADAATSERAAVMPAAKPTAKPGTSAPADAGSGAGTAVTTGGAVATTGGEFDDGGAELPAGDAKVGAATQTTADGFAVEDESAAPKVVITDPSDSGGILAAVGQWLLPIAGAIVAALLLLVLAIRSRRNKDQEPAFVSEQAPAKPRPDIVSMARGEQIPDPTEADAESADDARTVVLDAAPLAEDGPAETAPARKAAADDVDDVFGDLGDLDLPDDTDATPSGRSEDEEFAALLKAEPAAPETDDAAGGDLGELDVDFGEPPADDQPAAPAAQEPKSMFETASFPLVNDDAESKSTASSDDPVAEAEFQLAYGLYDEAEETLKAVLEVEPGRLDAMEKLAEVYFAAGREDDFEALAQDLKQNQGMTQEFRNVEALAQQLIPNSSLFSGGAAAAAPAPVAEAPAEDMAESETGAFDVPEAVADEPEVAEFAVEEPSEPDEPAEEPEEKSASDIEMVAFDMPEPDSAEAPAEEPAEEQPQAAEPMETVDFDMADFEAPAAAESQPAEDDLMVSQESVSDALDEISLSAEEAAPAELETGELTLEDNGLEAADLELGELDAGDLDTSELDDSGFEFDADGLSLEGLDDAADELSLEGLSLDDAQETGLPDLADASEGITLDEPAPAPDEEGLSLEEDLSQTVASDDTLSLESFDEGLGDELLGLDEQTVAAPETETADLTLADLESSVAEDDSLSLEMPDEAADADEIGLQAFDDGINDDGDMNGKLDLARGYVDMGEIDMARSLLDEVVTRGNDDQQAEARSMLESLA